MAIISETFLVTVRIDTDLAQNFPYGFRDLTLDNHVSGYNWNSYPNWDINYLGRETEFIEMVWNDFQSSFAYDGLNCRIYKVGYDD
jgi:hypothetical protein